MSTAMLGHSFGGQVALEYALRYPASVSHLVLPDTGGDSRGHSTTRRVSAVRAGQPGRL